VFRPPAGITSPRLGPVLDRLGMTAVSFSRRALDLGNRRIAGTALRILGRVRPGDIILLHDSSPGKTGSDLFLRELESLLRGLEDRGLSVIPLERLIGRPVMETFGNKEPGNRPGSDCSAGRRGRQ
jgi:hypothetical protein